MGKPILTTSPVPRQRSPDPELGGDGCLAPLTSVSANEVAHARLVGQRDDDSFGAHLEHDVDVLEARSRDRRELRMLLLDGPDSPRIPAAARMPHTAVLERAADGAV